VAARETEQKGQFTVCIISWAGVHEKAVMISREIDKLTVSVSIVYSDPDPDIALDVACKTIRRPNELFFEDKFRTCLDECGDGPLLVIHADCECDDWEGLIRRCIEADARMKNLGVWSPRIVGTYYDLAVSRIFKVEGTDLNISALTDAIVFSLSNDIVRRMRKVGFGDNPLGWGIDLLFCSAAHVMNRLVVIDEAITVNHPQDRGYDARLAQKQMAKFFDQFTMAERIECELLRSHVRWNHARLRGIRKRQA
jgi:hypothetical protein